MTAFVIDYRADKLAVGSDTLGYVVGADLAPVGFVSKVFVLPRFKAVLFGRGICSIALKAGFELMIGAHIRTFDDAAAALPGILRQVTETYAAEQEIDDHRSLQIFEAVFGGWDTQAKRMRLLTAYNYQNYEPEEATPGRFGTMIMPVLPSEFARANDGSLEKRLIGGLHAARRYFEAHPEKTGGMSLLGGEIELTEVTAAGINIRTIGRFADYVETHHAAAAVASRLARGDLLPDVRDGLVAAGDMIVADGAEQGSHLSRPERRRLAQLERQNARRRVT